MPTTFTLLVPVKAWDRAKTRMVHTDTTPPGDVLAPALARDLAAAFALDAVASATGSAQVARVYVVTDQPDFAAPGACVLPDEGAGDLNAALRAAELRVRAQHPELGVAAMCADVPCLRTEDLSTALSAAPGPRWFVADAAGTGTTLLAAAAGHELDPRFGEESARRHAESGAVPVEDDVPSLRLDVDTAADLARALALGAGVHTAEVLARHAVTC